MHASLSSALSQCIHGITVCAIEKLKPFPNESLIVPPSLTENLVTVVGTLNVKGTVAIAPPARGPTESGTGGPANVTVPTPPKVQSVTALILTLWAAVKPVFVSCRVAVTLLPDRTIFFNCPLRLGGPQLVVPMIDVLASAILLLPHFRLNQTRCYRTHRYGQRCLRTFRKSRSYSVTRL